MNTEQYLEKCRTDLMATPYDQWWPEDDVFMNLEERRLNLDISRLLIQEGFTPGTITIVLEFTI